MALNEDVQRQRLLILTWIRLAVMCMKCGPPSAVLSCQPAISMKM